MFLFLFSCIFEAEEMTALRNDGIDIIGIMCTTPQMCIQKVNEEKFDFLLTLLMPVWWFINITSIAFEMIALLKSQLPKLVRFDHFELFQTCMGVFLLQNLKVDILKNVAKQTSLTFIACTQKILDPWMLNTLLYRWERFTFATCLNNYVSDVIKKDAFHV